MIRYAGVGLNRPVTPKPLRSGEGGFYFILQKTIRESVIRESARPASIRQRGAVGTPPLPFPRPDGSVLKKGPSRETIPPLPLPAPF